MRLVLDASVALSWQFGDEFDASSREAQLEVKERGAVVPSLWHWEVISSLLSAEHRGRIAFGDPEWALDRLAAMPILTESTEAPLPNRALALARSHKLSGYDAAYLDLAIRRNTTLATRDRALAKVAKSLGISVVGLP